MIFHLHILLRTQQKGMRFGKPSFENTKQGTTLNHSEFTTEYW